jgi:ATP-dependent protease HslVU (ClpYQ) peptidase subunit
LNEDFMTVCIGVLPRFSDKIVMVSDLLLSSDEASVDGGMLKSAAIAPLAEWYAMFAGNPAQFLVVMDRVRELLGDVRNTRLSLSTVIRAVESAYAMEMLRIVESDVLQPYGLTRKDFIRKGKNWLGEIRFNQIADQVEAVDLGVELLVAGMDAVAKTQLFYVSSQGKVRRVALPYHAIGSGAPIALGTLYSLPSFPTSDLEETVYRACAAKFAAENVPSVGESTHAIVISPLSHTWTSIMDVDRLRELWHTRGQPPVPSGARTLIRRELRRIGP